MNDLSGKTLINVDIQPDYEGHFSFHKETWAEFLNTNYSNLRDCVFLYNGRETIGVVDEESYKYWLYDAGVSEEVVEGSYFYDKGYAFFRYCMDEGVDEDNIVNFIQFMIKYEITDSRDLKDKDLWKHYIRENGAEDVKDLLEHSSELIYIPDLMEYIKSYNGIVLTGGAINECLKEVEIALKALNKPYTVLNTFTY
jgi:hypothetical protein